jgi:sulfite reductase (NADPH) flavoprotein alpha-component
VGEDEAHLLIAPVRYETHGRARAGVASTFVADRLKTGAKIRARLKPNRHFHLPDPATDILMIGPGTGVAPFRAFVQERRSTGATGRNWLFFGDRRFTHDFLYQLEWQDALADGSLARLDPRFFTRYAVQGLCAGPPVERRREVVDWLTAARSFMSAATPRGAHGQGCSSRRSVRSSFADGEGGSPRSMPPGCPSRPLERERRYLQGRD